MRERIGQILKEEWRGSNDPQMSTFGARVLERLRDEIDKVQLDLQSGGYSVIRVHGRYGNEWEFLVPNETWQSKKEELRATQELKDARRLIDAMKATSVSQAEAIGRLLNEKRELENTVQAREGRIMQLEHTIAAHEGDWKAICEDRRRLKDELFQEQKERVRQGKLHEECATSNDALALELKNKADQLALEKLAYKAAAQSWLASTAEMSAQIVALEDKLKTYENELDARNETIEKLDNTCRALAEQKSPIALKELELKNAGLQEELKLVRDALVRVQNEGARAARQFLEGDKQRLRDLQQKTDRIVELQKKVDDLLQARDETLRIFTARALQETPPNTVSRLEYEALESKLKEMRGKFQHAKERLQQLDFMSRQYVAETER